ncbi:MAG: universal stress protein [Nitrososphaerales archaeon]
MSNIQIKKILLPIDGSEASMKAVNYAVSIAKQQNAQIICIHAIGTPAYLSQRVAVLLPSYYEEAKKLTQIWFGKVLEIARKEGVDVKTELVIDVASVIDAIVNYAMNENVDLIVMGTRGRTGLKKFLLGSIASGVVSHAHCSVLVVR